MARLIELESQIDELSAMEQQFGKDEDFPDGSCIMFNRSFGRGGLYSYAALKCAKNSWFITGKYQAPMTYEMLVENHLRHALEEDQLLVVVKKVQDLTTLVKK
jgi:1,4-dihydroxy-2-naphthoyl-CoA synthase